MSKQTELGYERRIARYMGVAEKLIDESLGENKESVHEFWNAVASGSELSTKKEVEKILRNTGLLIEKRQTKEVSFIKSLVKKWDATENEGIREHLISSMRRCLLDDQNFMAPEKWRSLVSSDVERLKAYRKEVLSREALTGVGEGAKDATKEAGWGVLSFIALSTIAGSVIPHLPMVGQLLTIKMPEALSMSGILASATGAVVMGTISAVMLKKGKTVLTQTIGTALPESLEKLDMDRDWGRALSLWHPAFAQAGDEQDMNERKQALTKEVKETVMNALDYFEVKSEQREEIGKAQAETLIRSAARVREKLVEMAMEKGVGLVELKARAKTGQLETKTREWFMTAFSELGSMSSMSGLNGLQKRLSGADEYKMVSKGIAASRNKMGHA